MFLEAEIEQLKEKNSRFENNLQKERETRRIIEPQLESTMQELENLKIEMKKK